ncbi:Ig-like domain-containing protein [Flammeovirga aprica]|uniref:Ig domain-containing protein n=1 Tax=Flammeovirga aprica JL-4 TaxID=694437 RepID=A0A7X9P220_9BACT|nr:Ig-like domain-containing protein [Flammeovirga aprica]NME68124.1 Ig domain-containing protein [Flammeovirga aprica JL-4]
MSTNFRSALFVLLGLIGTSFFVSCSSSESGGGQEGDVDPEVTGIVLDQTSLTVVLGTSASLKATLQPEGVTGDITWSTSDPTVLAVADGDIQPLKVGEANVAATHGTFTTTCKVTVIEDPTSGTLDPVPEVLQGEDYYVISLDETAFATIESKVTYDLRTDDVDKNFYIWENTLLAGQPSGNNYFGLEEGWMSLVVGSVGWSGAGYNVGSGFGSIDMTPLYNNPEEYYFHVAMKSASASTVYTLIFSDGIAEAKVVMGAGPDGDGVAPYGDFERNGEWQEISIPLTHLHEQGVFYNQAVSNVNIFAFLAGGNSGDTVDVDAVFFYKKKK